MIVPTIEHDGKAGELDIPMDDFRKPFLKREIKHFFGESKIDEDLYKPHEMCFKVDKTRTVMVVVYIHPAFAEWSYRDKVDRTKVIEGHIRNNAAWYFSYGFRETVKERY